MRMYLGRGANTNLRKEQILCSYSFAFYIKRNYVQFHLKGEKILINFAKIVQKTEKA